MSIIVLLMYKRLLQYVRSYYLFCSHRFVVFVTFSPPSMERDAPGTLMLLRYITGLGI